jgi:hypothetical protein
MFPSGDSPEKVRDFYEYLNGHQETTRPIQSWHVDWMSLAWLWGFVIVLALIIILWLWQYRSTRQRAALYPVDQFGGYTSELAGPATLFFMLFCLIVAAWAVVLIVGHLVWGQKF